MKVTVHYQTQLRRAIGLDSETLDIAPGCRLPELLETLGQRHGAAFRGLALDGGGWARGSLLLFVGDTQVLEPAHAGPLKDGDVVTLLAPMAGG